MHVADSEETLLRLHFKQAGIRGQSAVNLTDRAWVVLAGLDIPLQQLDHNSFGQVAGGAPLSHWRCVVERFHVILGQTQSQSRIYLTNIMCLYEL